MDIFGFNIRRKADLEKDKLKSFTPKVTDDGAVSVLAGGNLSAYIDLDGTIRTEAELVSRYREMSLQPEIDKAVNEITNEAIVVEEKQKIVQLQLDDLPVQDNLKKVISEEFENILDLLNFNNNAYDIFKRWYIDGRSYHHVIINDSNKALGIQELRYIDPRKIRKVREIEKKTDKASGITYTITKAEYFMYSERGLNYGSKSVLSNMGTSGVKIQPDSIVYCTSGLMDSNNTMVLGYLHPAIKPLNQLRALEDSTLIYHLSRAPERRIFYIDVGNLPKIKAEQYVRDMMTKFKNKLTYNAQTGEIKDDRKFMTMQEDFWLPRREGGRGTEISTLSGGTALPDLLGSVEYFQDRLYRSLQVPLTRMKPDSIYNLGRSTEITRDEVNFSKFIDRIRNKFSQMFLMILEKQLILKGIAAPEDWDELKKNIKFKFLKDNYFAELKELEIMNDRLTRLRDADEFAGKYFSHIQLRKTILRQTDEEIKEIDQEIMAEMQNPQYNPPEISPEDEVQNGELKR
jgi:Bacteriophage T4-like portal protein (Gp20)